MKLINIMIGIAKKYDADVVHDTKYFMPLVDEDGNMPLQLIDDKVRLFTVSGNASATIP